jgi:hypothetical protein
MRPRGWRAGISHPRATVQVIGSSVTICISLGEVDLSLNHVYNAFYDSRNFFNFIRVNFDAFFLLLKVIFYFDHV